MFKRHADEWSSVTKDSFSSYESFKVQFSADFVESNGVVPNVAETLNAYAKSRGWRSPTHEASASQLSFGGLLEKSTMGGTHFDQLVAHLRQARKGSAIDDFEATVQQFVYFMTNDIGPMDQTRASEPSTSKLENGSLSSLRTPLAPGYIAISNMRWNTSIDGLFPFDKEAMIVQSGTENSFWSPDWGSRPIWTTADSPGTMIPQHWVILINVDLLLMSETDKRYFARNTSSLTNPKELSFREFLTETAADIVMSVERRSRAASASPESLQPLTLNAAGYFISQEKSETQRASPTSPIETQLAEIEELLAKGLIDQAERDALRRRILGI